MDEQGLQLTTEEGIETWSSREQSSVIDLTFVSPSLHSRLVRCERADDLEHASDHFLIRTELDIDIPLFEPLIRRNWAATDDKKLTEFIGEHWTSRDLSHAGQMRIELECQSFIRVVEAAIDVSTPWARPSEWATPGFTRECREAIKLVRQLRWRYCKTKDPYDWMRYKEARNNKKRLVKGTLTQAHRRRVQQVIEEGPHGMWRLAKWARNRDGAYERGITPSLKQLDGTVAETVDEKASAFPSGILPTATTSRSIRYHQLQLPRLTSLLLFFLCHHYFYSMVVTCLWFKPGTTRQLLWALGVILSAVRQA